MKVLRAQWMRELDEGAIRDIGIPSIVLMENAARGAALFFAEEFPRPRFPRVLVAAGKGNNGGDGIAVGRILQQLGYDVRLLLLADPEDLKPDPALNLRVVEKLRLPWRAIATVEELHAEIAAPNDSGTLVVDALLGTGLNEPVKEGLLAAAIDALNGAPFPIAAVDVPSGLGETFLPEEGHHICATATATFQFLKLAHIHPDGNRFCGKIKVIDIGIPAELAKPERCYIELIEPDHFRPLFARRPVDAHKGDFGHVLTIAGSLEKPGAGILAAFAALRAGAGLCTAAVQPENRDLVLRAHPELMTLVYRRPQELRKRLAGFSVILAGPGLGQSSETAELVDFLVSDRSVPLVLDADAINVLPKQAELSAGKGRGPVILTPHPGEFTRLSGYNVAEIRARRIDAARDFAMSRGVHLLLKGHHTVLALPDGRIFLNQSGNPGMATAGSGDVLGGLIAGLLAQFYPARPLERILEAAVFLHGYAADIAARSIGEISLVAGDILQAVPEAICSIDDFRSPFLVS